MIKVSLVIAVMILLLVAYFVLDANKHIYWLTSAQSERALIHREERGLDLLVCVKVKMSDQEIKAALEKLSMQNMQVYPSFDAPSANCIVDWWDMDFPSDARWFKRENNGSVRQLATTKGGYIYHTYELR